MPTMKEDIVWQMAISAIAPAHR